VFGVGGEVERGGHEGGGVDPGDEAAVVAERHGVVDDLEAVDHALGHRAAVLVQAEAHHAGEIAHLAGRERVLGVRGEAGPEHALDLRVGFEEAGDGAGGFLVGLHADRQVAAPRRISQALNGDSTPP
jgi:hypothetical protein